MHDAWLTITMLSAQPNEGDTNRDIRLTDQSLRSRSALESGTGRERTRIAPMRTRG